MMAEPISGDVSDLQAALQSAGLPVDDLAEPGRAFFRFSNAGQTIGFGGFELYGENALLRSIVMLPQARGKGWGQTATDLLLQKAGNAGARAAYLLTTDAAPFFERSGFQRIERDAAPADILATRQAA